MSKIAILGAAESGVGAAVLAQKKGFEVFVSDMGKIKEHYKNTLDEYGIEWEEGGHSAEKILDADEIIKSPGIPDNAPMVAKAIEKGIHIINEIEFAGRYTDAKMICITGSNGKTTTTSLIYHILKNANYNVGLAGNIGRSLALQIAEGCTYEYYVIELSSFQLDNMYDFHANIAVLLNITPDHLDRYDNEMQKYADSKMRIVRNQNDNDAFIYWADDPIISKELEKYGIKARMCPFSILSKNGMIGYIENGTYTLETPTPFNMEQESLSLHGKHNMYNSLAAGIATRLTGVSDENLKKSLSNFQGVEHRLENVATVGGVHYINDSKATNVDACWYALESMTTPTILIIGGKDKGNDYEAIKELVIKKCAGLVFLGADNSKLHAFFDPLGIPTADTHSMKECIEACNAMAKPGYTVLLSPCCASFDLFKNMEDRGEQFKELVRNL
ncbi:MAG: UDP-N-acetylmuramoyl-L-alanine--D-glutamate ligase [Bacteroidaceae bacterium]|jgi:UDP-N-acetylmuramoylalanine--D-glutamate ligase|nr:UDP-N-acetylmuramoyl-L-alanine--D-glutamate ligase [Bacteroidaceae bacterium]